MQQQIQTPVPQSVLSLTEEFFEQFGLSELDMPTKLAFAENLYPQYLQRSQSGTARVLWTPINEMQRLASITPAFETFVGGRARSGKSDMILGEAFTNHKSSIIFRPEYSQLEALEERSREILAGTGAVYNASQGSKRWRNIPGGRTLKFGAIKHDGDADKYFGRPHDLVCFDEITKFKERHYLSVWAWVCSVIEEQRVRIICTGNPPTKTSELWVKQRWAAWVDDTHENPAKPAEVRWYVTLNGKDTEVEGPDADVRDNLGKKLKPLSRTFIPGELLHFYKGTNYEAVLDALPDNLRPQLRDGDFNALEEDMARQVIPTSHVRAAMARWTEKRPNVMLSATAVDVARGGDDRTVISKRYGDWYAPLIEYPGKETRTGNEVAAHVIENIPESESRRLIVVDLTGVGSSPYDILVSNGYVVEGYVDAAKSELTDASGQLSFANRRAEAWWTFAEALDPRSKNQIALPPDNGLLAELTSPTWELGPNGIQIEKKEKVKERIGRSPDAADAVVMNFNADVRRGRGGMPLVQGIATLGYVKSF